MPADGQPVHSEAQLPNHTTNGSQ